MERLRQNHLGGFFKVLKPGPRHAPVTAVPAAGPGNLHFARAAREVSQARSILGSANRILQALRWWRPSCARAGHPAPQTHGLCGRS